MADVKIKPWMYGVGVVGVGAVGIAIYEATKSAPSTTPPTLARLNPATPAVTRPVLPTPGTFSTAVPPAGVVIDVMSAAQVVSVALGTFVTLTLPSGGQWVSIHVIDYTTNIVKQSIDLGGDLTSAVSLPANSLLDDPHTAISALFKDHTGKVWDHIAGFRKLVPLRI